MTLKSESKAKRILLTVVMIGIVVPGGYGFVGKFIQFVQTMKHGESGTFAAIPIMNYLCVAAGFICLLVWATSEGMFRDIEAPKHKLLETEKFIDENTPPS